MMKKFLVSIVLLSSGWSFGQFAPPAGQQGSTAIAHDSIIIDSWLTSATIQRGYQDIATATTFASHGSAADAEGMADNVVVSLGDSGVVTYTLVSPMANHEGYDFAVFENSFSDDYLELAFVEVSSDGQYFVRFPAVSNVQTATQVGGFGLTNATEIHNFAGKYRGYYGTPFELDDLADSANVDIANITHIRIVDVVGSIDPNHGTYDSQGTIVNDPYPTDFASGGFDLDAVALLKPQTVGVEKHNIEAHVFPNPATENFTIQLQEPAEIQVYSVGGELMFRKRCKQLQIQLNITQWPNGVYMLQMSTPEYTVTQKIVKY